MTPVDNYDVLSESLNIPKEILATMKLSDLLDYCNQKQIVLMPGMVLEMERVSVPEPEINGPGGIRATIMQALVNSLPPELRAEAKETARKLRKKANKGKITLDATDEHMLKALGE